MPSLVVIGQQVKEKRREGGRGGTMITKYPSLNRVKIVDVQKKTIRLELIILLGNITKL